MATVPITCPYCGAWMRVSVQPSEITKSHTGLRVRFDAQLVAHICKEKQDAVSEGAD